MWGDRALPAVSARSSRTQSDANRLSDKRGGIEMRSAISALGIVATVCMLSIPPVDACGDKTLRIGRGARFQRTTQPAAVLIYLPGNSVNRAAASRPTLQSVAPALQTLLKRVNARSRTVQGVDGLTEALKAPYDVVLTDLAEAGHLQKQIEASTSKPVVIPVACAETKAQAGLAKKQYGFVVKNPTSGDEYLDAIEDAMRSRMRALAGNR
jgi:hypothetical protein